MTVGQNLYILVYIVLFGIGFGLSIMRKKWKYFLWALLGMLIVFIYWVLTTDFTNFAFT